MFVLKLKIMKARQSKKAKELFKNEKIARFILRSKSFIKKV